MTTTSLGKKLLKIVGMTLGILLVLLVGFHFWFKAHAKELIEELVESKSNGKLKLKIGKFHFNYFNKKIEMEKAVFYSVDTLTGSTSYRFSVDKIKLQAKAILPIVFKKQILIDSLTLQSPHIEVTRLRLIEKPDDKEEKKDVSIPEEMGKVYKSIQDALQVLNVKRFQIDDGTFTLINKISPDQLPITVSNLHFHIDNLEVNADSSTNKKKILFSENVVLRSENQDILFPDGRHRLSFSQFRINLKNKIVEFDSCTIAATRADSSSASFNIFFDALFLTNIDFDTLYKAEVIKADSVYCVNPKFTLNMKLGNKKSGSKPPPKLEDIIKQLTGDLQLEHVVVSNADFNIKTEKNGKPSSFTFSNNNFEMQGLTIDQEAAKPLKVKSFAMAIRNYENFIKDSSYSIRFDSVVFKDNRITLNNFVFNKLENGKILNTFSIPQFNLQGLSWDDLVFEKKLKAEQAIMFSPTIDYTVRSNPNKKGGNQTIFQSLGMVNDYMDLQYLDIMDGKIDVKLKNNLRVQLENADLSIKSNSLLTSTKLSGIKNSLTNLTFKNGKIQVGNMIIQLNDIRYVGKSGQFGAGNIAITDKTKQLSILLNEVAVQKMQVDEVSGNVYADGVKWLNGDVNIQPGTSKKEGDDPSTIELRNVQGGNTNVHVTVLGKTISTKLNTISFTELNKNKDNKLVLNGLDIIGKQLEVKDKNLQLTIADYDITDNKPSSFRQIDYKSSSGKTTATVSIPTLTVVPHIQTLINGNIVLDGMTLTKPIIDINLAAKKITEEEKKSTIPKIDISELKLIQPTVNFYQQTDSGKLSLNWHGTQNSNNFLQINDLQSNAGNTSIRNMNFYLTDFLFSNPAGKKFNTGNGKVSAQIKSINLTQKENSPIVWDANVTHFDASDLQLDSIGKTKANLVMKSGQLNNLAISSTTIKNLQQLVAANNAFEIKNVTGNYLNADKDLRWFNAGYNRRSNFLSLDSFSFAPTLEKDSFIAKQAFQTDYITFKSGAVKIGPIDMNNYVKNNKLNIGSATIDNFLLFDYKDKQQPFNAGIIKPLPVDMIKKIPLQLSVDTILLNNANVSYTEVNEKIKKPGTITVNRMTVRLIDFKNYNIGPTDSLRLHANGYLMDTAWIRLRVKESYTDSLGGFLMTVRIKPSELTILNPVLVPLASIKIESGFLDTLSMRAVGREYLSLGEMNMHYHDLKLRLLKNGDITKKSFLTGILNLVVKNKNTSRTGTVFFIRKRDRSAINYLIKIALSGMASSVGVKSNKKMLRKYREELEKRKLPPIDLE